MQTYVVARLDEIDALPDGRYRYRPVRHHLGIQSFGVTAWVGAAAGDPIINEYDEDSEPAEELFVVVSGRAIFELEGEKVEATRGTLVFTQQGARRTAVAAEPATTILAFDGMPGKVVRRQRLGAVGATQAALRQGRARPAQSTARRPDRRQSAVSDARVQPGLQREPERPHGRRDRSPATRGRRV